MIPIDRGPEPPSLTEIRGKLLPKAIDAFNAHGPGSKEPLATLVGYDDIKKDLYLRQHRKCAYCERTPGFDGQPVEHFRPKKHAVRESKPKLVKDAERYWWLTWTWDNLLFACTTCNGPARKGNHFPLAKGSTSLACPIRPSVSPLPASCLHLPSEHPLLLDPSDKSAHPLDHLRWVPVDRGLARSLWTWELRRLSMRGHKTAEIIGLDDLADDVDNRYREVVWPRFQGEIESKLGRTALTQLLVKWQKLVRDLVRPSSELTAATWSMLDVLRGSTRALRDAELPAPPRP